MFVARPQCVVSNLLALPETPLEPGCCCDKACDIFVDDVAVYLGLSGEVKDALLDAEMLICEGVVEEAAFLRKTRAGGNWLTGGMVVCM